MSRKSERVRKGSFWLALFATLALVAPSSFGVLVAQADDEVSPSPSVVQTSSAPAPEPEPTKTEEQAPPSPEPVAQAPEEVSKPPAPEPTRTTVTSPSKAPAAGDKGTTSPKPETPKPTSAPSASVKPSGSPTPTAAPPSPSTTPSAADGQLSVSWRCNPHGYIVTVEGGPIKVQRVAPGDVVMEDYGVVGSDWEQWFPIDYSVDDGYVWIRWYAGGQTWTNTLWPSGVVADCDLQSPTPSSEPSAPSPEPTAPSPSPTSKPSVPAPVVTVTDQQCVVGDQGVSKFTPGSIVIAAGKVTVKVTDINGSKVSSLTAVEPGTYRVTASLPSGAKKWGDLSGWTKTSNGSITKLVTVGSAGDCSVPKPGPKTGENSSETPPICLPAGGGHVEITTTPWTQDWVWENGEWKLGEKVDGEPVITSRQATEAECPTPNGVSSFQFSCEMLVLEAPLGTPEGASWEYQLDGTPVEIGEHSVAPGEHTLTLTVNGVEVDSDTIMIEACGEDPDRRLEGLIFSSFCGYFEVTNPAENPIIWFQYGSFNEEGPDGQIEIEPGQTFYVYTDRSSVDWMAGDMEGLYPNIAGSLEVEQDCSTPDPSPEPTDKPTAPTTPTTKPTTPTVNPSVSTPSPPGQHPTDPPASPGKSGGKWGDRTDRLAQTGGDTTWLVVGGIALAVGLGVIVWSITRRKSA